MSNRGTPPRWSGTPRIGRCATAPESRGRAGLLLLLSLALLVTGGLVAAFTGAFGPEQQRLASPQPTSQAPNESELPRQGAGGASTGRIEVGEPLPYKDLPRSYVGRGHITGVVEVIGGRPFPEQWTLVIEPSTFGSGREHAVRRVQEFDGDTRTFEEMDLPLGGYTVSAQAEGLNSRPQELLLFALPGSPIGGKTRAHLILHLTPTGFVDGSVRDTRGAPVGDLPVFLENISNKHVLETLSAASGSWRFKGLRDGRYRLHYGSIERPLIPPRDFTYNAPQRQFKEDEVPATASVAFWVLDETGLAVMDARVRGFGRPGGQVVTTSGFDGKAIARFLPGGRYQIKADHAVDGLEGKADFIIEGDEVEHPVQVVLYPKNR